MARLAFVVRMLRSRWRRTCHACPYCGSTLHHRLQRKKFVIEARKCEFCDLVFRWPTDDTEEARRFYEGAYEGQQATDTPVSDSELNGLLLNRFQGTPYDKSHRIETVRRFLPKARLLDFGCSWGYSVAQ